MEQEDTEEQMFTPLDDAVAEQLAAAPLSAAENGPNDVNVAPKAKTSVNKITYDYGSDDNELHDSVTPSEGFSLPELTAWTVNETLDDTDLTIDQLNTIQIEEAESDRFVREIAPTDCFDFSWTDDPRVFTGKREVFTDSTGPTFTVTDDMTVLDVFHRMFDKSFINLLVTETNSYADQNLQRLKNDPSTSKNNRGLKWTPTDRNEMMTYLAVIILQGLYPKIKEEAYFNYDGFGTTPYFGLIMPYSRYYLLKTFLHFVNNEATTDKTGLRKIRPITEYFNKKFSSLYKLGREISIEESLLKYGGRLSFSQKIASKAARVGVKTYELCETSTGYLYAFRVHTGKDETGLTESHLNGDVKLEHAEASPEEIDGENSLINKREEYGQTGRPVVNPDNSEFRPNTATSKIVYDLVKPLLNRGHTLVMDSFYNSPLLARCLKRNQTDVFGTLRLTREFVPESIKTMKKQEMGEGEVVASYCSDLAVMLWHDVNLVGMISTFHPVEVRTYDENNKVAKPAIVLDYNKCVAGVDRKDQFLAGQPLEKQKNRIWYKKLFRRLFNTALFNCFVIFTSNPRNNVSHRQFRIILAESLLTKYRQIDVKTEARLIRPKYRQVSVKTEAGIRTKQDITTQARPYIEGNHFPVPTGSKHTCCWLCARSHDKRKSRTSYKCEECNVNLCLIGCFKAYHKPPPGKRQTETEKEQTGMTTEL